MTKDNDFHVVNVRLSDEQYKFIKDSADYYGISVSLLIRLVIESTKNKLHWDIGNDR